MKQFGALENPSVAIGACAVRKDREPFLCVLSKHGTGYPPRDESLVALPMALPRLSHDVPHSSKPSMEAGGQLTFASIHYFLLHVEGSVG